jgi:hypothetical protein
MASCEVARHGADLICISLNIHRMFLRSYTKHLCVGVWVCGGGGWWMGVRVRAGALLFDICHQGHTGACA